MNKVIVMLALACACSTAQEHSNYGYAVLASPEPVARPATNNATAASSAACSQGTVTVTLPTNNQTVSSPVKFQASATADPGQTIVTMQIYVDSTSVYSVNAPSINTSLAVASGTHSVIITATESNGALLHSPTLSITVKSSTGPVATFLGCVYNQNGSRYQAVRISLNQSATVTFDANLYYGTSCNPSQWADEFGFGQQLSLSSAFSYIFWFTDFKNQMDMSALWKINNQTSVCVNYLVAPPC
jgi:Bacterial Ig domain